MKTYIKKHKTEKIAEAHANKIRARGGNVKSTKVKDGWELEYSFGKKERKPKKVKVIKGSVYKLDDKYYKAKVVRASDINTFEITDKEGNVKPDGITGGKRLIGERTDELILIKK